MGVSISAMLGSHRPRSKMHRHVLGRGIAKRGWMHKVTCAGSTIFDNVQIMALQMQMSAVVHMPVPEWNSGISNMHASARSGSPIRPRQFRFVLQPEMPGYRRVRAYWSDQEHAQFFQPRQTSFRDNRIDRIPNPLSKAVTVIRATVLKCRYLPR